MGLDVGRRRQLVVGLILLAGGLVVLAIGTIFPSNDPLVALGWLLLVPLLVSLCGTVLVFISLVRNKGSVRQPATVYRIVRIVGIAAVAGLGLSLGYGVAGFLSQVPDSLAGLNGPFVPGSGPGLSGLFLCGMGLAAGLLIGVGAALTRWLSRRRATE